MTDPPKLETKNRKLRLSIAAVLAAVIVTLWFNDFPLSSIREDLQAGGWISKVLFVVIGITALTLLVPKTAISMLCGSVFGWSEGITLMLVVAVCAALINYYLGYFFFRTAVDRMSTSSERRAWIPILRHIAKEANAQLHFLVRMTPIPTAFISYAMGSCGSRIKPFLVGTALAIVPQSLWINVGSKMDFYSSEEINSLKIWSLAISILFATITSGWISQLARKRILSVKVTSEKETLP